MNKNIIIIAGAIVYLLSAVGSYAFFSSRANLTSSQKPTYGSEEEVEDISPRTEACPLNGELYSKEAKAKWEARRPVGVMIQNHIDARPQSGLSGADIIHEIVAEGGITRFLAIYYCEEPQLVGSVRSARIYFIKLLQGFGNNPLYLHIGGANTDGPADALGILDDIGWRLYNDIDGLSIGLPIYRRLTDRLPDRDWEHTSYALISEARKYATEKRKLSHIDEDKIAWDEDWEGWEFQKDAKEEERGATTSIAYGFWDDVLGSDYTVAWTYDPLTNTYARENGGEPHIDHNTNKQLRAKNVIVVFADESVADDGYEGGQHLLYDIIGSDDALIFFNGNVIEGTYEKEDEESMMRFYDEDGEEISLVGGKIWISVLPTGNEVTY